MEVAIILPTLNEGATIGKLVDSLVRDPYPDKEIIVVDGGSTDGTVNMAKKSGAIVLKEKGKYKCLPNARNQGARESRAEILCFLDGDYIRVGRHFITNAMKHFKNPNVIGVVCRGEIILDTLISKAQESVKDSPFFKFWGRKLSAASGHTVARKRVPFLRKRVFEKIGGYPLLGFGEDGVFLQKLNDYLRKNPNEKVVVEQNSVVFMRRASSIREFFKGRVWYGRTIVPYLKTAELSTWFKLALLLLSPAYLISMISIPLVLISPWFLILALPYITKLLLILYDSIRDRDKYRLLTPPLDFISSAGFTIGLLQYLAGKGYLSRG